MHVIVFNKGGAVAQRVERWTCDQQGVGSNPTRGKSCSVTSTESLYLLHFYGIL